MATFLDSVNRVLRIEGIIRGDDDNITSFSSSQHAASIESAQIAIQEEVAWLTDCATIPYERTSSTITLADGTRTYTMPSDFLRFTKEPYMYWTTSGNVDGDFIVERDEADVRALNPSYESDPGTPTFFYFTEGTTTQVGMYPVPDSGNASEVLKFWYDKTVMPSVATDTIPLITTEQVNAFASLAARKFKFLRMSPQERDALFPNGIERDTVLESKRATLLRLLKTSKRKPRYGRQYA